MSLRLICGRAGTGKSDFCLEEIKKELQGKRKIYIITPEQYSFTAEQKLLNKIDRGSVLQAEVLTFARMSYRVLNEVGGITKPTLSKPGKAMVIYDILENQKENLNFLGKSKQNVELVDTILTELKKHQVTLENLNSITDKIGNPYLERKLKDITNIYQKYEEILSGKYIEENDRLEILANQLDQTNMYQDAIFYIDEFTGFTKQEYKIIEKLLKIAYKVNITITTDNLDTKFDMCKDLFYSNKQTADKLLYIAKKEKIDCDKTIFLNKSYRFKNEQLRHLEKNIEEIPYKEYKEENYNENNISIFLANNPYAEVENTAREIVKLVKNNNYRYKDIVIISKQLDTYGSLCKAIFNSYQIPAFIDEKKQLNQNVFAKYILSLLEIYTSNWSYEAVIQYIKSGFINIDEKEIYEFENFTRKWGIKGSKWYKQDWNFIENDKSYKEKLERMNEIRKINIMPLINLKEKFSEIKTIRGMNKALYEFLIENNIQEEIKIKQNKLEEQGKLELSKEQKLAWDTVIEVLDEMNTLFEDKKTTFSTYRELLKVGLGESGLGEIPLQQDQIIVGDVDRTRSHKVKAVFILGVNDGVFPGIRKQEGFLNDKDREELKNNNIELAKGTLENLYEENFSIYKAFTTAEERLYISYCSSDSESKTLRPSIYITKLKKIFPNLKEKSDILQNQDFEIITPIDTFNELINNMRRKKDGEKVDNIWDTIEKYYEENEEWKSKLFQAKKALGYNNQPEKININNIQRLYGNVLQTSISKLEQYKNCPFSYYLKYGLKLKEQEEYKIKSIDTGTFMHETIDEFFHIIRQRQLEVKQLEEKQIKEIIEEIINNKLGISKYYIFTSSDKFKALTIKLKRVVLQSMKYLIEGLKNSDFRVMANELEFKSGKEYKPIILDLENGKKVEITGKIDRIDIAKTTNGKYIRIIDYKSSVKNIDLNEFVAGLQIQLLTYLDATCKIEEVMPAGVLYYNLIDPILKSNKPMTKEEIEEEMKKKFKMNGLILGDVQIIKMMDKSLNSGASSIIPAYLDKEGNISASKSNTVSDEQFKDLMKYTNKIIKDISKEILNGNISIKPYYQRKNKKTACDYCNYNGVCNFKENCEKFNYIENDSKDVILNKIREDKQ